MQGVERKRSQVALLKMECVEMIVSACCGAIVITLLLGVVNWLGFRPKKLEKLLKNQGVKGNSYRILYGDIKEFSGMIKEVNSKPMTLSDDIASRLLPFFLHTIKKYGKKSFIWLGSKPLVFVMDPELIKEVFTKNYLYQKPNSNPLTKLLAQGLINHEGDKWPNIEKSSILPSI